MPGSVVRVRCNFCGNSFLAHPKQARCQKCGRPANRSLDWLWRALSFLVPPVGLGNALWIRAHSPVASMQGLAAAVAGVASYGALFWLLRFIEIF